MKKPQTTDQINEVEFYKMHSEYWCKECENARKELWNVRKELHEKNMEIIRLKANGTPRKSGFGQ